MSKIGNLTLLLPLLCCLYNANAQNLTEAWARTAGGTLASGGDGDRSGEFIHAIGLHFAQGIAIIFRCLCRDAQRVAVYGLLSAYLSSV